MYKNLICLILATALACSPFVSRADPGLQDRFEKSLQNARGISGIEVDWLDTYTLKDPAILKKLKATTPTFSRTFQYSFITSGTKFRAVRTLVSSTHRKVEKLSESAFDGSKYATYTGDERNMTVNTVSAPGDNSESSHNPLVAPFMFLSKYSDDCRNCKLRFTDLTSEAFTNAVVLRGEKRDGAYKISLPGLTLGNQPTTWTIDIDEHGDEFMPKVVRFVSPGSKYEVVHNFLEYTNVGAYRFPSRIEWTMTSYPPTTPATVIATGSVTVTSARIRENMDDSVFRLDKEQNAAAVVWDWHQHHFIKSDPQLAKIRAAGKSTRAVLFVMFFVTTAIFLKLLVQRVLSKQKPD